jgi:hypothetical protein
VVESSARTRCLIASEAPGFDPRRLHFPQGENPMTSSSSNGQLADVVEGLVESTNDRGIRAQGEWHE